MERTGFEIRQEIERVADGVGAGVLPMTCRRITDQTTAIYAAECIATDLRFARSVLSIAGAPAVAAAMESGLAEILPRLHPIHADRILTYVTA